MFPIAHILQVRRNDRPDWAAIGSAISMAANILIHRAGIQTGPAPDTIEAFSCFLIGQDIGTSIVQQYHIHLFRAIRFTRLAGSAHDRIIDRYLLARTIGSQ